MLVTRQELQMVINGLSCLLYVHILLNLKEMLDTQCCRESENVVPVSFNESLLLIVG